MMTNTSPLAQYNVEQLNANDNNNDRFRQIQRILPNLLLNVVVPLLVNMLTQRYMSTINALLLASAIPTLFTLGGLIAKKRIDAVGVVVAASLLLSAVFALLFKTPQLLLLRGAIVSGLLGVAMLISLLFPRPVLFYLVRSVLAQSDPRRLARFDMGWSFPQIRSSYRTLTVVWGCVNVAQLLLLAVLAFTLSIPTMLVLDPILSIGTNITLVHWTIRTVYKNKRILDQVR